MRDIKYTGKVCHYCGKRIYFEANASLYVDDTMNCICSSYCDGLNLDAVKLTKHVPTTEVETA
jgi:hypothetical protein